MLLAAQTWSRRQRQSRLLKRGTFLLRYLVTVAKQHGIGGFTAEVLRENRAMQAVFQKSGCKVRSRLSGEVYSFELDFA